MTGVFLHMCITETSIIYHIDNVERKFVGKIKNLLELLPENFAMTGQSYIINFRHMKECNANAAIMDNGACISISRNFKKDFSFKLMDYNRR